MQKRTREIVALVMLLVLATAGIVFMGWYIKAGHNWNMAATTIDDRFGKMDGYVVVLYKGTNEPAIEEEETSASRTPAIRTEAERVMALRERAALEDTLLEKTRASYQGKGANVFVIDAQNPQQYIQPSVLVRNGYRIGVFSVTAETPYLLIDRCLVYFALHEVNIIVVLEETQNEYAESVSGIDIVIPVGNEPIEPEEEAASTVAGTRASSSQSASSAPSNSARSTSSSSSAGRVSSSTASQGASESSKASSAIVASEEAAAGSQTEPAPERSNAFFVKRFDRGEIGVILISPNNLVSSKTISE